MRIITLCFMALLAVPACHKDSLPGSGTPDLAAAADAGGAASDLATARDGAADLSSSGSSTDLASGSTNHVCSSSTGNCPNSGVTCGNACCPGGEWCDPATLTCQCGSGAGCQGAFICIALTGPPNASPCGETCEPVL